MSTVEHAIERSLGKAGGQGNERAEVRFWLSTTVNGRKAESRGTTVTIEQPTLADIRQRARGMASFAQMRIDAGEMDAKAANAALPSILAEVPDLDKQWDEITKSFGQ